MTEIKDENVNNAIRENVIYLCTREVCIMRNSIGATKTIGTVECKVWVSHGLK